MGARSEYLEELKIETVARLEKALWVRNNLGPEFFYLSGGKFRRNPTVVDMMKGWLVLNGQISEKNILMDTNSVQTCEGIEKFVKYLFGLHNDFISVYLTTSWYHLPRCRYELKKSIEKFRRESEIDLSFGNPKFIEIIAVSVKPPWTLECLKYEYLYNLLVEPINLIIMRFPKLKKWLGKRERKNRGVE